MRHIAGLLTATAMILFAAAPASAQLGAVVAPAGDAPRYQTGGTLEITLTDLAIVHTYKITFSNPACGGAPWGAFTGTAETFVTGDGTVYTSNETIQGTLLPNGALTFKAVYGVCTWGCGYSWHDAGAGMVADSTGAAYNASATFKGLVPNHGQYIKAVCGPKSPGCTNSEDAAHSCIGKPIDLSMCQPLTGTLSFSICFDAQRTNCPASLDRAYSIDTAACGYFSGPITLPATGYEGWKVAGTYDTSSHTMLTAKTYSSANPVPGDVWSLVDGQWQVHTSDGMNLYLTNVSFVVAP